MKATLTFNLSDHSEKEAHQCAVKSVEMGIVLWNMIHVVRRRVENEIETGKVKTAEDALDEVFFILEDLLEENHLKGEKFIQ